MDSYRYLIIGGGMAADAAIKGIRDMDSEGSIGMIGAETHPPYARPPLSKKLWRGKPLESIWLKGISSGISHHNGRTVTEIEAKSKRVRDDQGDQYRYEKLLLATGGTPRSLPFADDKVIYFRTLDDYQRVRTLADEGESFAVIGGGFIGSEMAAALNMNGRMVTLIFPEKRICDRLFPAGLADYVTDYYRGKGVRLLPGERVPALRDEDGKLVVVTAGGGEIEVGGVVAGLGIEANTDLAQRAGLKVNNGIVVDKFLRVDGMDIYAAGDAVSFPSPHLGEMVRFEHEDNAVSMGRKAGRNMAGAEEPYEYLPYFYSDLFDLGYEAVGFLDSRLETVEEWLDDYRKGVVYYLRDGRVRGVLLWGLWKRVEAARELIAKPGPIKSSDLMGLLTGQ